MCNVMSRLRGQTYMPSLHCFFFLQNGNVNDKNNDSGNGNDRSRDTVNGKDSGNVTITVTITIMVTVTVAVTTTVTVAITITMYICGNERNRAKDQIKLTVIV